MTSKKKLRRRIAELEAVLAVRDTGQMAPVRWNPVGMSGSTVAPWCATCQSFHIPGGGPCTATFTWTHE